MCMAHWAQARRSREARPCPNDDTTFPQLADCLWVIKLFVENNVTEHVAVPKLLNLLRAI